MKNSVPVGHDVTKLLRLPRLLKDVSDSLKYFQEVKPFNSRHYMTIVRYLIARIVLKGNRPGVASGMTVKEFLHAKYNNGRWNLQVNKTYFLKK